MNKKILFILLLSSILFFIPGTGLYSYIYTKEAAMIEVNKFKFNIGYFEYYKNGIGSVFKVPFVVHLGLTEKIEFIGVLPYLQLRQPQLVRDIETFGDLLLYLKIHMANFHLKYPIINLQTENQLTFVIGFNTATGPNLNTSDGKHFWPYSISTPDFRIGLLYNQEIRDFSINFDFIYTFASQPDEEYLPFSGSIWSTDDDIYLFGLINVIVKFLWPGEYPWADDTDPEWEKYPHIDDFFIWNTGLKYYMAPEWLAFSYDFFVELNWINTWSQWAVYPSFLLVTPGIQVYLSDSINIVGGASFLIDKHVYQFDTYKNLSPPPEYILKKRKFPFDNLYFIGIKFFL